MTNCENITIEKAVLLIARLAIRNKLLYLHPNRACLYYTIILVGKQYFYHLQ